MCITTTVDGVKLKIIFYPRRERSFCRQMLINKQSWAALNDLFTNDMSPAFCFGGWFFWPFVNLSVTAVQNPGQKLDNCTIFDNLLQCNIIGITKISFHSTPTPTIFPVPPHLSRCVPLQDYKCWRRFFLITSFLVKAFSFF